MRKIISARKKDSMMKEKIDDSNFNANLMSIRQVAAYLNFSVSHLYRLTSSKSIPLLKIGRALRFSRGDLDKWLANKRGTSDAA